MYSVQSGMEDNAYDADLQQIKLRGQSTNSALERPRGCLARQLGSKLNMTFIVAIEESE